MNCKIITLAELTLEAEAFRRTGRKLVLTNGCFDLLHIGHVRYLCAARELGDALAVAVNGDVSVRVLKGAGRPLNNEDDRAEVLAALSCVDFVTVFPEVRVTSVIDAVRPAIYVKGGDYAPETLDEEERAALTRAGSEIRILPLVPGRSTSRLVDRIQHL
jgi:rfaE bifunctional protein nucleotidyltransferase chain/domain